MSEKSILSAVAKKATGTGPSRAVRAEGRVPGIIYGGKKGEVQIALDQKELFKTYTKGGFFSRLVTIDLDGQKIDVLPREVQIHPLSDLPVHADFQQVEKGSDLKLKVRVIFINHDKSPGLKRGGVLNIVRHVIELKCPPENIPSEITVDLSGTAIGSSIHISSIALPEGVKPVITRDFTVATIAGRASEEDKAAVAAAATPAAAPAAAGSAAKPAAKPAGGKK